MFSTRGWGGGHWTPEDHSDGEDPALDLWVIFFFDRQPAFSVKLNRLRGHCTRHSVSDCIKKKVRSSGFRGCTASTQVLYGTHAPCTKARPSLGDGRAQLPLQRAHGRGQLVHASRAPRATLHVVAKAWPRVNGWIDTLVTKRPFIFDSRSRHLNGRPPFPTQPQVAWARNPAALPAGSAPGVSCVVRERA